MSEQTAGTKGNSTFHGNSFSNGPVTGPLAGPQQATAGPNDWTPPPVPSYPSLVTVARDAPDKRYLASAPDRQTARRAQARYAHMLLRKGAARIWSVAVERCDSRIGSEPRTTFVLYLVRKEEVSVTRMGEKLNQQPKRKLRRNRSIAGRDDRHA